MKGEVCRLNCGGGKKVEPIDLTFRLPLSSEDKTTLKMAKVPT